MNTNMPAANVSGNAALNTAASPISTVPAYMMKNKAVWRKNAVDAAFLTYAVNSSYSMVNR